MKRKDICNIIRMENGEAISRSGWSDEKSDCVEEGQRWLDHIYVW